jgi:hypothetical protein
MVHSQTENLSNKDNSLFYRFPLKLNSELAVIFSLLALLIIFRLQAFININRYYIGSVDGDAGIYLWLIKTNLRDLVSLNWFDKAAFYPYGKVLAWSDNFILPSLIAGPMFLSGLNDQCVFNILLLLAVFLNGYCTYRLFYHLSGERFASFFAGSTFMTLPYFTHQSGHPQLLFFFFIPLSIDCLVAFLNRPHIFNAAKIALVLISAFLTTVSCAVFAALISSVVLLSVKILRPQILTRNVLKPLVLAALLSIFVLLPFFVPYFYIKTAFGERQMYEAYYFSANIFSYLSSTPFNVLYSGTQGLSHSEAHLFPGLSLCILTIMVLGRLGEASKLKNSLTLFLVYILTASVLMLIPADNFLRLVISVLLWLSIFQAFRLMYILGVLEKKLRVSPITARDLIAIFGIIGFVFFCISLGPLGNPEKGQYALAPYSFFYTLFPGFSSIRAVSRAGAVVLFSLCLLAALYISIIYKKRALRGAAIIAWLFCLVENYNSDFPLSALPLKPENFTKLAALESKGAAVVLPLAGELDSNNEVKSWSQYAKVNMTALLWAAGSNRPLVNGYSGQKTKIMRDFPRELKDFPSGRALNALGSIAGVKYIIYVPEFNPAFKREDFESQYRSFPSQLKLISTDEQGTYLFEIFPELQNLNEKSILIPPGKPKKLAFEIRTAFKQSFENAKVSSFIDGTVEVPFFEIKADGSWNTREINIPKSSNNVKPRLLTFNTEDSALVLKNLKLSDN